MPGEYRPEREDLESKLRLTVLRQHVADADQRIIDHVIHELGMLALGRNPDGSKRAIQARTQVQAMAAYLRSVEKASGMGTPEPPEGPKIVNVLPGEQLLDWLKSPTHRAEALAAGTAIIKGEKVPKPRAKRKRKSRRKAKGKPKGNGQA